MAVFQRTNAAIDTDALYKNFVCTQAEEVSFSELQFHGKATAARVQRTRGQSLLIRRRSGDNLVLTTAERAGHVREASSISMRVLSGLLDADDRSQAGITTVLSDVFPWTTFLPTQDLRRFADELATTLKAADTDTDHGAVPAPGA